VRGAEGRTAVRPGMSSDSTWSERPKNYIRNVEAVGSNPITSTKSPGHGLTVETPKAHVAPSRRKPLLHLGRTMRWGTASPSR